MSKETLQNKELINKYKDVYYKDFSQMTDREWKRYLKFLDESHNKGNNRGENQSEN